MSGEIRMTVRRWRSRPCPLEWFDPNRLPALRPVPCGFVATARTEKAATDAYEEHWRYHESMVDALVAESLR